MTRRLSTTDRDWPPITGRFAHFTSHKEVILMIKDCLSLLHPLFDVVPYPNDEMSTANELLDYTVCPKSPARSSSKKIGLVNGFHHRMTPLPLPFVCWINDSDLLQLLNEVQPGQRSSFRWH
jgi:hypothetical protein